MDPAAGRRRWAIFPRRTGAIKSFPFAVIPQQFLPLLGAVLLPAFPGLLTELLALFGGHGFPLFAEFLPQALALLRGLALPLLANLVPHLFPLFRAQGGQGAGFPGNESGLGVQTADGAQAKPGGHQPPA
jgi:hypothetical protein